MLKILLALLVFSPPVFGETLLSGAVYFDSENTMLEVTDLLRAKDMDGLTRLFKGNHISAKLPANMDIIVLRSGLDLESPAEFRFANNPTTYWTYSKYVSNEAKSASASPSPSPIPARPEETGLSPTSTASFNPTLPANLPSSLGVTATPTPMPKSPPVSTPTPTPSPTPKAVPERENISEEETPAPLRRHRRIAKERSSEEGVPESAKVWHRVNGHLKWYDKRNLHEVRRAIPLTANAPTAAAIANPTPTPTPLPYPSVTPVPRATPVRLPP